MNFIDIIARLLYSYHFIMMFDIASCLPKQCNISATTDLVDDSNESDLFIFDKNIIKIILIHDYIKGCTLWCHQQNISKGLIEYWVNCLYI